MFFEDGRVYEGQWDNDLKMARDSSNFLMAILTKEITLMENQKEQVFINGVIDKYMMVSGLTDKNMVQVYGRIYKGIHISVNGNLIRRMDMEYIYGVLVY